MVEASQGASIETLARFLDHYSADVISSIAQHGAVLFRGFAIQSPAEFEQACLSVRGFHTVNEVFMSEAGRTLVEGTQHVLHTNTLYKTGGSLSPFSFHTENFYVPDVPRYISFFCQKASWLGGETGLIDMMSLFSELPEDLKSALCRQTYLVARIPASRIQQRYDLTEEEFITFFSTGDFTLEKNDGRWELLLYKPCVLLHPETRSPSLQVNLAGELNSHGLEPQALQEFRSDFAGAKWLVHRMCWNYPAIPWLADFFRSPVRAMKRVRRQQAHAKGSDGSPAYARIGDCFKDSDIRQLAKLMRSHYSSFRWQSGDILMIDNLRMAHAGMPGLGARDLKALICNRLPLPCRVDSPGYFVVPQDFATPSVGDALLARRLTRDMQPTS